MSVIVTTSLTQYGAVSNDYTSQHLPQYVTGVLDVLNNESDYEFDYNMYHLPVVRSPLPRAGSTSAYYKTEDEDTWSDSPTVSPSMLSNRRFAYGLGGSRTGNLDNYVGVVIHNNDYANEGGYSVQNHVYTGDMDYAHLDSTYYGDYLVQNASTPTGDVNVQQFDLIVLASPEPFSYRNAVSADVSIRLSNYVYPLSSGTVTLFIEGEEKEDIVTTPFYGGRGGFDALWVNDREFDYNTEVDVEWHVFDESIPPNEFVIGYWFRTIADLVGPRISGLSPQDDEVDVSIDSCIQFTLRDYERDVNMDSLELYINNQKATASGIVATPLSSSDGFSIRYCPENSFLYGDEIPVSIYVEDTADNTNYLFHTYSFTTELSNAPRVVSTEPVPCRKLKPTTQDVEVDVVDGGHGLDEGSILFSVDDKTVPNPRKLPIIYRED